jgi:hypothetical protein
MSILDVEEQIYFDNSIINAEKHPHLPYASTSFNNNDEIRIPIQQTDIYTLPSASSIYIEGKVTAAKDLTKLLFVNNAFTHLFEEIRYELGGKVIDKVRNPGITTTLKGYVSHCADDISWLSNSGWLSINDRRVAGELADINSGNFNITIPLKNLLGFAEDYNKIIMNIQQELVLIRSNADLNAVLSTTADEKIAIIINKIIWKVPHIQVADIERLNLLKIVDRNSELSINFRTWELYEYASLPTTDKQSWMVKSATQLEKPRYIIVAFQTNRKNKLDANMCLFDHCKLTNLKLYLNSEVYPYDNQNLNFTKHQIANLYEMYAAFQSSYYDSKPQPLLNIQNFKEYAPIGVIDCSRQNEVLNSGTVDIRLEMDFESEIPAHTTCYCLIIHDRIVKYSPLTNLVRIL